MNAQKIISLSVSNFMRVSAVSIELSPEGELVILAGENEQGKSSVIKAIEYVLGGKDCEVVRPIKDGANEAKVIATLTDYIVTRTTTAAGTSGFKVTTRDKKNVSSPQTLLNGFISALSFDPLHFHRIATKEPAEAVKLLMKLAGLDFTKLDERRKSLYDERTDANRTLAQSKAKVVGLVLDVTAPADEIVTADLVEELRIARARNTGNETQCQQFNSLINDKEKVESDIRGCEAQIESLEKEIQKQRALITGHKDIILRCQPTIDSWKKEVDALVDIDETSITERISGADAINAKVRSNRKLSDLNGDIEVDQKTSDDLTAEIEAIDKQKEDALTNAKFPVPGISFNDAGVVLGGVPWSQCSTAQRLKATTSIGIALNPGLRAILIREGGNDLDKNSMAVMAGIAKEHDVHIVLERCTVGPEASFVIEDGHIKQS